MEKKQQTLNIALLIGIILVATNLRAPITSVGSLVSLIKSDLQLNALQSGVITTIPLLCFAIISPLAPKISRKIGIEKTFFYSLIVLFIGIIIRSLNATVFLFAGTVLLGCAIAISNVLIPGLIKKEFDRRSGLVTGIYSVSMNLCGAIASGISFPLATTVGLGWAHALQIWVVLAIIALIGWFPQMKRRDVIAATTQQQERKSLWKSKLAWFVTAFMGLQSLLFYVLVAWLPSILGGLGIAESKAGLFLSIIQITMLPITFVIPIIAEKQKNQRFLVLLTAICLFIGILPIFTGIEWLIIVGMVILGIGSGSVFSLAMMFFSLRTSNVHEASELSGMAQSVGYLLASVGPLLVGAIYDATHTWTIAIYILLGIVVAILIAGMGAGKNSKV